MAAPQPDLNVLSDSLVAAGRQVSLLPNLPAINHERYLRDQFTALQQRMDEQFRLLREELNTRFEQVQTQFETRFVQVDTRFANLEISTRAEARNQAARVFNSHVTSVETALHTLVNQQNEVVEGFPRDLAGLARLNDNAITALLNAYDLATGGNLPTKRRRFRFFIGAVINA